jgi:molybdate transport system regulatory protein
MKPDIHFHIRAATQGAGLAIGPGKVALLEAIAESGSISAAARKLGMSYRRAWILVDETNRCLLEPAVHTIAGGKRGGGAALTDTGMEFVRRYRALERRTGRGVTEQLAPMLRSVAAQKRTLT